jgi:hypothetical protein
MSSGSTAHQSTRFYLILDGILNNRHNWEAYTNPTESEQIGTLQSIVRNWLTANNERDAIFDAVSHAPETGHIRLNSFGELIKEILTIYQPNSSLGESRINLLKLLLNEMRRWKEVNAVPTAQSNGLESSSNGNQAAMGVVK